MKKIVLLVLGLLFLSGCVSAYQVNIYAPDSLTVGKPLIVTGTTSFGVGTPIDVVLYYQLTTSTEIQRQIAYVQSDKTFKTVFDTTGLDTGTYKVEVPAEGLGDSVNSRVIQLVDRDDEIHLASPTTQNFSGNLSIAGTVTGDENAGIQVEVTDTDGLVVFGPQYMNTDDTGDFIADIPVSRPGNYDVSFTDARGYIGTRTITVAGQPSPATSSMMAQATASPDSPVLTGTGELQNATPSPSSPVLPAVSIVAVCLAAALAGMRKIQ
jgi:hypothetical protein